MTCEEAKRQWLEAEAEMLKVRMPIIAKSQATEAELKELREVDERYAAAGRSAIKAMEAHA